MRVRDAFEFRIFVDTAKYSYSLLSVSASTAFVFAVTLTRRILPHLISKSQTIAAGATYESARYTHGIRDVVFREMGTNISLILQLLLVIGGSFQTPRAVSEEAIFCSVTAACWYWENYVTSWLAKMVSKADTDWMVIGKLRDQGRLPPSNSPRILNQHNGRKLLGENSLLLQRHLSFMHLEYVALPLPTKGLGSASFSLVENQSHHKMQMSPCLCLRWTLTNLWLGRASRLPHIGGDLQPKIVMTTMLVPESGILQLLCKLHEGKPNLMCLSQELGNWMLRKQLWPEMIVLKQKCRAVVERHTSQMKNLSKRTSRKRVSNRKMEDARQVTMMKPMHRPLIQTTHLPSLKRSSMPDAWFIYVFGGLDQAGRANRNSADISNPGGLLNNIARILVELFKRWARDFGTLGSRGTSTPQIKITNRWVYFAWGGFQRRTSNGHVWWRQRYWWQILSVGESMMMACPASPSSAAAMSP